MLVSLITKHIFRKMSEFGCLALSVDGNEVEIYYSRRCQNNH